MTTWVMLTSMIFQRMRSGEIRFFFELYSWNKPFNTFQHFAAFLLDYDISATTMQTWWRLNAAFVTKRWSRISLGEKRLFWSYHGKSKFVEVNISSYHRESKVDTSSYHRDSKVDIVITKTFRLPHLKRHGVDLDDYRRSHGEPSVVKFVYHRFQKFW